MIQKGSKVYWLDPAIEDYPEEDRLKALARIFTVYEIKGDIYYISDGCTETEVFIYELIPIEHNPTRFGTLKENKMNRMLNIERYVEDGIYHAYIREDGSSGYDCVGITPEICTRQVENYIKSIFNERKRNNPIP